MLLRRGGDRIRCHWFCFGAWAMTPLDEHGLVRKRAPQRMPSIKSYGGGSRIRTGGKGFAGLCLTTWPLRRYEKGRKRNRPSSKQWSGQRGSNPRPQPWQGCALPTEPCPLARKYYTQSDDNVQVIFHDCLRCWGDPWGRPDSDRLSSRARRDKSAPVPRRRVLAAGLVGLRESQASSSRSVRGNLRKTRD